MHIHYAWLQRSEQEHPLLLPEDYLQNLTTIATEHPDWQLQLWVDSQRSSPQCVTSLQTYLQQQGLHNIQLQDLQTIPAYAQDALMATRQFQTFYPRAPYEGSRSEQHLFEKQIDLTKLYILRHGAEANPTETHAFSDLDIRAAPSLPHALAQQGFAIGSFRQLSLENQFFAFAPAQFHLLQQLFQLTRDHCHHYSVDSSPLPSNGFTAVREFLYDFERKQGREPLREALVRVTEMEGRRSAALTYGTTPP